MKEKIAKIKNELEIALKEVLEVKELNDLRIKYLGKKGLVTLLKEEVTKSKEKKEAGLLFNQFKNEITEKIENQRILLAEKALAEKLKSEKLDLTLSSTFIKTGSKHPLTLIVEEIEELFIGMGYQVVAGPEIEEDLYNFERLNLPKDHPARDSQDSFYITEKMLLRTQTSPIQVRIMEKNKEKTPIRIICPGKVFRKDDDDATHSHQFMQIEGLVVDENVNLGNLKATLEIVVKKLFGNNHKMRFRPSFFPFTEPSIEVDIACFKCKGIGCALCKESGWIEILGAGMVHPNVLEMSGYDSKKYRGFAFGLGPERIAMLKYGIDDIRQLYANHFEFLETFKRIEKEAEDALK